MFQGFMPEARLPHVKCFLDFHQGPIFLISWSCFCSLSNVLFCKGPCIFFSLNAALSVCLAFHQDLFIVLNVLLSLAAPNCVAYSL